jgi:hypothetical protein
MSPTDDHLLEAARALAAAREVLPIFEQAEPGDNRPRKALDALVSWLDGEAAVAEVRKAAFDSHAAARDTSNLAARYAARACGQAAAVAHVKTHAPHAIRYAEKSQALF